MNYVFYVCDMADVPVSGRFRKMDAEREIASHISRGLSDCIIKKYTEYDGEQIEADSVGIVFPAHMWGVSLAVFSFLQHIRINEGTYIYAVAVGESLSGAVNATTMRRVKILNQFKRIFEKKGFGDESDIFIRCIDRDRTTVDTERKMLGAYDCATGIKYIMEGLLFHDVDSLMKECRSEYEGVKVKPELEMKSYMPVERKKETEESSPMLWARPQNTTQKRLKLTNVYLDEELMAGVKLCQVI